MGFITEYCLYVFIAVIGAIQFIAARWEFHGISFFRNKAWGYVFGTIAIVGVFVWFFTFTDLDLTQPTFDTRSQMVWLLISTICALLFTLAISSAIKRSLHSAKDGDNNVEKGLDTLKRMTYFKAIARYFKGKPR
jgi:uncharacterized PurR-regulated membrane protein YhhQ (DUF165 family)